MTMSHFKGWASPFIGTHSHSTEAMINPDLQQNASLSYTTRYTTTVAPRLWIFTAETERRRVEAAKSVDPIPLNNYRVPRVPPNSYNHS
jgi:hypothetical protein